MRSTRAWKYLVAASLMVAAGGENCADDPDDCGGMLCTDIVYTRSGGFAGINESITVEPDGTLRTSGGFVGDSVGTLTPAELGGLVGMVQRWHKLPSPVPNNNGADFFNHAVAYNGRTLTWTDLNVVEGSVSPALVSLTERLSELAEADVSSTGP